MYYGQDDDRRAAEGKRIYQKARYDEWLKLRQTERNLFIAAVKAWRKNKSEGRWRQADELGEWVTREQIADELGAYRLIPYYIKLLEHLSGGRTRRDSDSLNWIQKAKRTRWRRTYEGRKRPAGYEWVYLPSDDVIEALNAMNPNNPQRKAALAAPLPAAPKYQPPLWERVIDKVYELFT